MAVDAGAAPPAAATTHVLFMGVDLRLQHGGSFHQVSDVAGGSFVLVVGGRRQLVPIDRTTQPVKIDRQLKITRGSVTIGGLRVERAYTPAADPRRRWAASATAGGDMGAATRGLVASEVAGANVVNSLSGSGAPAGVVAAARDEALRGNAEASGRFERSAAAGVGGFDNAASHAASLEQELSRELYDAVEVTFELSAGKPLADPYVVVIAEFREQTAAAGKVRNWIYAKALEPVDGRPQKVRFLQGGFPPGFSLENHEVHIYDAGREIATNVSPKRVELTSDEALQYLVIEHVAAHKSETLAPIPAIATLPSDLPTRLAAPDAQKIYFVKVSKDGRVTDVFRDARYSRKVEDPYWTEVLRRIGFKPALDNGRPVDGQVEVNLARLPF